jgi:hypothetical protein
MKRLRTIFCAALLLLAAPIGMVISSPAAAKELASNSDALVGQANHQYANAGVIMTDAQFDQKVAAFRDDVLHGRKSRVAAAVAYPALAGVGHKRILLRNASALMRHYNEIFSPAMIESIRQAKTHDLFSRDQGVMLGNGQVWFNADGKVETLNNYF